MWMVPTQSDFGCMSCKFVRQITIMVSGEKPTLTYVQRRMRALPAVILCTLGTTNARPMPVIAHSSKLIAFTECVKQKPAVHIPHRIQPTESTHMRLM